MISTPALTAFLNLQKIVLETEDNNLLVANLLPKVLSELSLAGSNFDLAATVFLDGDFNIKDTFFIDGRSPKSSPAKTSSFINTEVLFQKGSVWELELLSGHQVVLSTPHPIVSSAEKLPNLRSLVLSPIKMARSLLGVLILGSGREKSHIDNEELELIGLVKGLVSLGYRLQYTQSSLSLITRQIYQMNAQLHQLDRLKDDFVSMASHELRTPMTAIKSYLWMALYRPDIALSDRMTKYLSRAYLSTERLINLVNDMLNVSRIEAGRINVTPKAFDLVKALQQIMEDIKVKVEEKGIRASLIEQVLPAVFADPDKVSQVVLNLLGNALKFTPPGGTITISFFTDGKTIETSIKDSGAGIAQDDLSRLFKKFGRLDDSYVATATSGGTGLGLYIAKSLLDLMHGAIRAYSEGLGKGATFIFALPVATPAVLEKAEVFTKKATGEAKDLEAVAI